MYCSQNCRAHPRYDSTPRQSHTMELITSSQSFYESIIIYPLFLHCNSCNITCSKAQYKSHLPVDERTTLFQSGGQSNFSLPSLVKAFTSEVNQIHTKLQLCLHCRFVCLNLFLQNNSPDQYQAALTFLTFSEGTESQKSSCHFSESQHPWSPRIFPLKK